jgi:hypothetical protein
MKKFYGHYKNTRCKDEIIIYAENKQEAWELLDNYSSKIDDDYQMDDNEVFDWPPKEKFDRDNTLIIRKDKVIEPKLKPIRTFSGELLYNLWPPDKSDTGLAYLDERETKKLRKDLYNLIKERIKLAKIKYKNNEIKNIKANKY